jgi:hypothetical protein
MDSILLAEEKKLENIERAKVLSSLKKLEKNVKEMETKITAKIDDIGMKIDGDVVILASLEEKIAKLEEAMKTEKKEEKDESDQKEENANGKRHIHMYSKEQNVCTYVNKRKK